MNIDVAFGQYYEGSSLIHKLDPRFKLIISILFIVEIFFAVNIYTVGIMAVSLLVLIILTGIPPKIILRGMKSILFIIFFTAIFNVFWFKGEELVVNFYFIKIYREGIYNALLMVFRIAALLTSTSVLISYTTTPLGLTDALERLLSPLAKLKLPVHEFSMMMTMALRFIPVLIKETDKIKNAQLARGASFTEGGIISRAKALIPIMIPLLASSLRRSFDLADAMECRCYSGGGGRTKMNVLRSSIRDYIAVAATVLLGVLVITVNNFVA